MTYEIEEGVEIPPKGGAKYPWARMQPGDSIAVLEPYVKGQGSPAGSSASSWVKRNEPGWSAVTRRQDDEVVRVWFTKAGGVSALREVG